MQAIITIDDDTYNIRVETSSNEITDADLIIPNERSVFSDAAHYLMERKHHPAGGLPGFIWEPADEDGVYVAEVEHR